jgi:hypothetical protein
MSLPDARADDGMGRTYILVLICHAAVITLLWLFGRLFSH